MLDHKNNPGAVRLHDAVAALLMGSLLGGGLIAWLLLGEKSPYNALQPGVAAGFALGCVFTFFMAFAVFHLVTGAGMLVRWWQRRAKPPAD